MMGRDLGCDSQPLGFGAADHLDRAGRGQMQEVHRCAGEPHEGEITCEHRLLRERGLAGNAEPARPGALVHVTPGRELEVLAVLGEDDRRAPRRTRGRDA